jgi:hypothetical protein
MARVTVTCPDRRGVHVGFYSVVGYFPVGATEVDLSDAQIASLEGEIARQESILTVARVPASTEKAKGR